MLCRDAEIARRDTQLLDILVRWRENERNAIMVTFDWTGASGKSYVYHIYEVEFDPTAAQDGNYIFAKVVEKLWRPIYVGEGDLKDRLAAARKDGCVTRKGATHVHMHLNSDEDDSKAEESDILAAHSVAYAPTGCNVKPSG
jgi:hypothetical protein